MFVLNPVGLALHLFAFAVPFLLLEAVSSFYWYHVLSVASLGAVILIRLAQHTLLHAAVVRATATLYRPIRFHCCM